MNTSTARNHEWDYYSPYNYPPMESDVCECDSRYCTDCSRAIDEHATRTDWTLSGNAPASDRLWLTYYKIKRWLKR